MVSMINSIPDYTPRICSLPAGSKDLMSWEKISHLLDMKKDSKGNKVFIFTYNNKYYYAWQAQAKDDHSYWHLYIQSEKDYEKSKKGHLLTPEVDVTSDSAGKIVYGKQLLLESQYALLFALQNELEK